MLFFTKRSIPIPENCKDPLGRLQHRTPYLYDVPYLWKNRTSQSLTFRHDRGEEGFLRKNPSWYWKHRTAVFPVIHLRPNEKQHSLTVVFRVEVGWIIALSLCLALFAAAFIGLALAVPGITPGESVLHLLPLLLLVLFPLFACVSDACQLRKSANKLTADITHALYNPVL